MSIWPFMALSWTRHGRRRAVERDVPDLAVRAALYWGFRQSLPDDSGFRLSLDKLAVEEAAGIGLDLAPFAGLEIITNRDETIRTVYWGGGR